jgi:hypothetical protein
MATTHPFISAQPFSRWRIVAGMKQIVPLLLALVPLVAVVSACVVAP